jgi:hypothetical protein
VKRITGLQTGWGAFTAAVIHLGCL